MKAMNLVAPCPRWYVHWRKKTKWRFGQIAEGIPPRLIVDAAARVAHQALARPGRGGSLSLLEIEVTIALSTMLCLNSKLSPKAPVSIRHDLYKVPPLSIEAEHNPRSRPCRIHKSNCENVCHVLWKISQIIV